MYMVESCDGMTEYDDYLMDLTLDQRSAHFEEMRRLAGLQV